MKVEVGWLGEFGWGLFVVWTGKIVHPTHSQRARMDGAPGLDRRT